MTLSIYDQRKLDWFIDQHDQIPNNQCTENVEVVDENFIDDFKRAFIPENTCVDSAFVHDTGRYLSNRMNLRGVRALFEGVFHNCPENLQSVLCHDRHPNPMAQINAIPISQTRYASKTQSAIEKIKKIAPEMGTRLEAMAQSGMILYTQQKYAPPPFVRVTPALIDPVHHTIILTEVVFTSYPDKQKQPIRLFFDSLREELKRSGANFQPSRIGEDHRYLASALGLDPLFVEENLVHELEHLNQINPDSPDNDFANKQTKWVLIPGYFYDLSIYMYLFGTALEANGLQLSDVFDGIDQSMAIREGLEESITLGNRITEDRAKTVAGETIQKINRKTK